MNKHGRKLEDQRSNDSDKNEPKLKPLDSVPEMNMTLPKTWLLQNQKRCFGQNMVSTLICVVLSKLTDYFISSAVYHSAYSV